MSQTRMEVQTISALVMLAILFGGIRADLFHRVSDDPLKQWSVSVYRTIPVKESASLMQKCAICTSDARCSGFTLNDLNLLLFDLNGNTSSSQLAGIYINLDRLFANQYTVIEINVDWNPNIVSSMMDKSGLAAQSQPMSEMGCLSECFFQLGPICQFFYVVDSVCYFGNFNQSTGHEAMPQYTMPLKIFLRNMNLRDYNLKDNQPKTTFADKIFDVVDLSSGIDACKYYCYLFYADPCDFYVIFDNKCWLGNQSDPTSYNLANNLPDTISVYLPPPPLILGKLLVTNGMPVITSNKTESFDVVASTACQSMPDYPLQVQATTGAFVNGRVVICGGKQGSNIPMDPCYSLGPNETVWTLNGNLITPRWAPASAVFNNILVIFGGFHPNHKSLQSTEEFDVEAGTATTGPNMPVARREHCAEKINSSTVLIIGGYETSHSKSTYFYNYFEKTFKAGPNLMQARNFHTSAILYTGTASYVVVTGGAILGVNLDSTEFIDLNDPTIWMTGPVLPKEIILARMVQHSYEAILSGGFASGTYQKDFYKLTCVTQGCTWQIMTTQLAVARRDHVSVVVPDNFVNCP